MEDANLFRLKVWGDHACFTRPEMKVERVSYDVMTPSAARGIVEAVLWKKAIRWVVTRIDVLKPIRWASVRRNEVSARASMPDKPDRDSGARLGIDVEDVRQQRAGLFLRDVAYVIHARFEMTDKAEAGDNPAKFREMFERYASKGKCFHRPYLGCREFACDFELVERGAPLPEPIGEDRELGWMLFDLDYSRTPPAPLFFRAGLKGGVLHVPPRESGEVRG